MSTDIKNPLEMSDEDFINQAEPEGKPIPAPEVPDAPPPEEAEVVTEEKVEEKVEQVPGEKAEEKPEAKTEEAPAKTEEKSEVVADPAKTAETAPITDASGEEKVEKPEEAKPEVVVDKSAGYDKIMAPFKANGKTIELKSPEEAIQLMQMGANYTRKLQELAPHRRVLTMLQNNDLLDENKLSFLIDLDKKNPDAVKKLIKDAGLDPLEIDTSADSNYVAGDHTVSDEEVKFRTVIDELASDAAGKETLAVINTQWDAASKEILWTSPEVATAIHEQRENGVYAKIAAEVDRQRLLGQVPANMPFLQAYTEIGKQMAEAALANPGEPAKTEEAATTAPTAEPIATRAATPKSPVVNSDKASAASPTRAAPSQVKTNSNPLAMSDEEFMKLNNINV
jgi:hypothetical protein